MKTSTKLIVGLLTLVLLGITIVLSIAKYHAFKLAVEPAGKIISNSETLGIYSHLVLHGNYKVHLSQGKEHKYEIKGDENYVKNLRVIERDGFLEISPKEKSKMKDVEITLYFENLEGLEIRGGMLVDCLSELHGETINIKASAGSLGTLLLKYNDVKSECSSGSNVRLKGTAENLNLQASSGSNVDAKEFETKNSTVEGSSGANIFVNVREQLNGNLSSGANLSYAGNPSVKNVQASSGGSISED